MKPPYWIYELRLHVHAHSSSSSWWIAARCRREFRGPRLPVTCIIHVFSFKCCHIGPHPYKQQLNRIVCVCVCVQFVPTPLPHLRLCFTSNLKKHSNNRCTCIQYKEKSKTLTAECWTCKRAYVFGTSNGHGNAIIVSHSLTRNEDVLRTSDEGKNLIEVGKVSFRWNDCRFKVGELV